MSETYAKIHLFHFNYELISFIENYYYLVANTRLCTYNYQVKYTLHLQYRHLLRRHHSHLHRHHFFLYFKLPIHFLLLY